VASKNEQRGRWQNRGKFPGLEGRARRSQIDSRKADLNRCAMTMKRVRASLASAMLRTAPHAKRTGIRGRLGIISNRSSAMANKSWYHGWGDRHRDVEKFRGFKSQVDSLFEDWFGRSMGGVLAPRLDIAEDEKAVTLTAELPGVKEGDIEVSIAGDQLTIKGEKRSEHDERRETDTRTLHRMERSYGAFQRTVTVPYQVDPEQVSAQFRDGVLTITLPKPPDAVAQKQARKVPINATQGSTGGGSSTP